MEVKTNCKVHIRTTLLNKYEFLSVLNIHLYHDLIKIFKKKYLTTYKFDLILIKNLLFNTSGNY